MAISNRKRIHPLNAAAAVSVIVVSVLGMAVLTGVLQPLQTAMVQKPPVGQGSGGMSGAAAPAPDAAAPASAGNTTAAAQSILPDPVLPSVSAGALVPEKSVVNLRKQQEDVSAGRQSASPAVEQPARRPFISRHSVSQSTAASSLPPEQYRRSSADGETGPNLLPAPQMEPTRAGRSGQTTEPADRSLGETIDHTISSISEVLTGAAAETDGPRLPSQSKE